MAGKNERLNAARLCVVTDRTLAKHGALKDAVEAALAGGVRMVQLREKDLGARELLALARALRAVTEKHGAMLIINDRADVAAACKADGVHLTRRSFAPADARRITGEGGIVGVSCHSLDEAREAQRAGADYVTLGPVFDTPSKAAYGPALGTDVIAAAARELDIFIYAIGGIKPQNAADAVGAGAHGIAVISALLSSPDAKKAGEGLCEAIAGRAHGKTVKL